MFLCSFLSNTLTSQAAYLYSQYFSVESLISGLNMLNMINDNLLGKYRATVCQPPMTPDRHVRRAVDPVWILSNHQPQKLRRAQWYLDVHPING